MTDLPIPDLADTLARVLRPEYNVVPLTDAILAVDKLLAQIEEARSWARHGYEIGQRSNTWADHGVAPAWLTEGHSVTAVSAPEEEPETEQQLHARCACPGWEYATTEGPRKQWDDQDRPPSDGHGDPDPSWEVNVDAGRDGWERFDYTEEAYWRRRKPDAERPGPSS